MQMGYSFVWVAKTSPWLISPDGHRIDLKVHGNIPFLRVGNVTAAAMIAQTVPKVLPTPEDQEDSEPEWKVLPRLCAPARKSQMGAPTRDQLSPSSRA